MERFPEQNKIESGEKLPEITLHFFRHSEKESGGSKTDEEINLTEEGRKMAIDQASPETNINQSVAFGSPKKRTQETALYHMLGVEDEIDGGDTFEVLKEKVNKDLEVGSKVGVDMNLDFPDIGDSPYKQKIYKALTEKAYVPFLIHESDKLGREFDAETETYSFKAAQIAEIIQKYLSILPRWEALQKDKSKEYTPNLERFLGTHGGIQECFLAKLLELTDGVDDRERFIQSLPSGNGFSYNEGMEVTVLRDENGSEYAQIEYRGEKYQISKSVSPELINKIANSIT